MSLEYLFQLLSNDKLKNIKKVDARINNQIITMIDEIETYLSISSNKFTIYLFDKKNLVNLYKEQIEIESNKDEIDFNQLILFLEKNIFKIEKLIGKFIKNISLILDHNKILNLNLCLKKKNYNRIIDKKYLENILMEAKDLFKNLSRKSNYTYGYK